MTPRTFRLSRALSRATAFPLAWVLASTAIAWGCTNAPILAPAEVDGFSDPFDGAALSDDWTVLDRDDFDLEVAQSQLRMTLTQDTMWYMRRTGPGVVREVQGNFHVTAHVSAMSAANPDEHVEGGYQFAGLIARNPEVEGDAENYVFHVLGWRDWEDYLSTETKSTRNGSSVVTAPQWPSPHAELRICRHNAIFVLLARESAESEWSHIKSYTRTDLPGTLQVGAIAYAEDADGPDLLATWDELRFAPVQSAEDCWGP